MWVPAYGSGERAWSLTVGGVDILPYCNLNEQPVTFEEIGGNATGSLDAMARDIPGNLVLPGLSDVILTDHQRNEVVWSGTSLIIEEERRPRGKAVFLKAVTPDSWLDWRKAPRYRSVRNIKGKIRNMGNDRAMVQKVISDRARMIAAPFATIDKTRTGIGRRIDLERETVRGVLEKIAGVASTQDDPTPRRFYVDYLWRLHYYSGSEAITAPYGISDEDYVAAVKATSGLVELWPLREENGGTFWGTEGATTLDRDSGVTSVTGGVVNIPSHKASNLDASGVQANAATPAALYVGGSPFSFEWWGRLDDFSNNCRVMFTFAAVSENGPEITVTSARAISVSRRGGGGTYTASAAWPDDDEWHHVVVTVNGSTVVVYVDGEAVSGSGSPSGWGDTWTAFSVSRDGSDNWKGDMQFLGWYDAVMSAADVATHYRIGRSIVPDTLRMGRDWGNKVHAVYVVGKNAKASGWVRSNGSGQRGQIQEFIDRPRADTKKEGLRAGRGFLRSHGTVVGGQFTTMNNHGWRAGQLLTVTDDHLLGGITQGTYALKAVRGELTGAGVAYEVEFGALGRRVLRELRKRGDL